MDSGLQETVIQFIPPEYQSYVITMFGIVTSLVSLYLVMKPFIDKWASNRNIAAINDNAIDPDVIAQKVEEAQKQFEFGRLTSELVNWKYKLVYATDETRPMIEAEIQRIEIEIAKYA